MNATKPIRVVIVDDQPVIRSGLGAFIRAYPRLQLVGEAGNGSEAIELCALVRPDVVLMDLQMPNVDGLSATRTIAQKWPDIHILVLTSFTEKALVQDALDAGAVGFMLKDATADELVEAIIRVNAGDRLVPRSDSQSPPQAPLRTSQRMSQELEIAGKIQNDILPSAPPEIHGWDLCARLVSARETSGDFYDFIPLVNNNWGLVIADVADKGMGAALYMAMSNTLLRTYATQYAALPGLTISNVNERLVTNYSRGNMFVTVFYGVLEPHTGRLRYVNAGHNPPYHLSDQKGKRVDRLRGTGMALGVMDSLAWQQKVIKFSPGDMLLLYTDGITEAQNQHGHFFGEARLLNVLRIYHGRTAREVVEGLIDAVRSFCDAALPHDDIAVMAIVRKF